MLRNYKKRRDKITFEALMQVLSAAFTQITDHQRSNASNWLADLLRSAKSGSSLNIEGVCYVVCAPSLLVFTGTESEPQ